MAQGLARSKGYTSEEENRGLGVPTGKPPCNNRGKVEFRILGSLEVVTDGQDVTPVRPKQRALLAFLLLRANEVVSNDELLEALWGEAPPRHSSYRAARPRLLAPKAPRIERDPDEAARLRLAAGSEIRPGGARS
jgi:hypothetical protein